MPQNIEIKARFSDVEFARQVAAGLGARPQGVLEQVDTYFRVAHGRLKLRQTSPGDAELIHYERPNALEARRCRYRRVPVVHAEALSESLSASLGVLAVVHKRRELWLLDNVRIHLDTVDRLGQFLELEAIVGAERTEEACRAQVEGLLRAFLISAADLVAVSYSDLVQSSN